MRYLLLLHGDPGHWDTLDEAQQSSWMRSHAEAEAEARRRGVYLSCQALRPVSTAQFVRVRSGKSIVTDGAFVESKEQLGGYYLLDCQSAADALEIAADICVFTNRNLTILEL